MEDNGFVLALPDGTEVELVENWAIDDKTNDSYPEVEIIDCEANNVVGRYRGTLPDTEDEDFDLDKLLDVVENALF